eukprot:CAMPEP_0202043824 /NCGR_PEP_ID=MMETSP0962-20130828/31397_1 /ASSEMBLY_ACC=CAM_ASM_000488 /TAXON_ID=4773 /ORGANISM="Schizochytrium aggregatum, Strain ATCC28209" /LENGTH=67 /DNA_ID=CAMNT_0048608327 /DNA_START=8 /DNA_END=211 /DNA_ORIENTATION=-
MATSSSHRSQHLCDVTLSAPSLRFSPRRDPGRALLRPGRPGAAARKMKSFHSLGCVPGRAMEKDGTD